jgi:hypothetical protein
MGGQRMRIRYVVASLGVALGAFSCTRDTPAPTPAASLDAGAATEPRSAGRLNGVSLAETERCYAAALQNNPALTVETEAHWVRRNGRVTFVLLEMPEAPDLVRCIRRAIEHQQRDDFAGRALLSFGFFPIRIGKRADDRRPSRREFKARARRFLDTAFAYGAISPGELPAVTTNEFPNEEQQDELQTCYEAARREQPELIVHRKVLYLARAKKVLLADVQVPDAPELAKCLIERIEHWACPHASSVLSSFWIDLGAAPEWPATERDFHARRARLLSRALEQSLIAPDDPLFEELKLSANTPSAAY